MEGNRDGMRDDATLPVRASRLLHGRERPVIIRCLLKRFSLRPGAMAIIVTKEMDSYWRAGAGGRDVGCHDGIGVVDRGHWR